MEKLPMAQQIKIIKAAALYVSVMRAPTEEYDIDHPSRFDKHIAKEDIQVNIIIGFLLRTIEYLAKEHVLSSAPKSRDLFKNLRGIKKLLESQTNTQPQYQRTRR
jgi:hypothetical protein